MTETLTRREYKTRFRAAKNQSLSEVGDIPPVVDPLRRSSCEFDLHRYLVTYFPESTGLSPFSDDHIRAIKNIETCLLSGGRYAEAVFRGFSKTTILENSCIWATSYGHRSFVPLLSAEGTLAANSIDSIRKEFEQNELLFEDFPEICCPVAKLEGKWQRCNSQTYDGERTFMKWTGDFIALPTIEGSAASGAIIMARGLLGANRGLKIKHPNGRNVRPDAALIDDFQTDESARHPGQVKTRLNIIRKAILKSAGHRKTIACVVAGTVIEKNDAMEVLLADPGWQSDRIPMVTKWADRHDDLWVGTYKEIRQGFDKDVPGSQLAAHHRSTEFYREHQDEMDAGCVVCWESCFDEDCELSAIQHAYNLRIDDGEDVFNSECQQKPTEREEEETQKLKAVELREKQHAVGRGKVPLQVEKLIAFVDVQMECLFYQVWGYSSDFDGFLIDYGTTPDQQTPHFEKRSLRKKLSTEKDFKRMGLEARLYKALLKLTDDIVTRKYKREVDGVEMQVKLCGIDSRYKTSTVRRVYQDSEHKAKLQLCMGYGIGAKKKPMRLKTIKKNSGQRKGFGWFLGEAKAGVQTLEVDTNVVKGFFRERLVTAINDKGSFSIYKVKDSNDHLLLSEHWTSEYSTTLKGPWGEVDEFDIKPHKPDNDYWDCGVGAAAIASLDGSKMIGADENEGSGKPRTRKVDMSKWKK